MKPIFRWPLLAALLFIFAAPDLLAQSPMERAQERAREIIEEQNRQADRDRRGADRNRQQADRRRQQARGAKQQNQRGGQAGGPRFCRDGSGHPQFGMRWCEEKGFATPYGRYGNVIWQRGSLGDVIIGDRQRGARQGTLSERILRDTIGRQPADRARTHGRSLGLDGALTGRWIDANTLELLVDGRPVARLSDPDRRGRMNTTLLARYR